jgi:hypothetical protein
VEEEQVGWCEPGRNDEDPCSFAVTLWCRGSDEVAVMLEQWLNKRIEYK